MYCICHHHKKYHDTESSGFCELCKCGKFIVSDKEIRRLLSSILTHEHLDALEGGVIMSEGEFFASRNQVRASAMKDRANRIGEVLHVLEIIKEYSEQGNVDR